jgi:aspartate/methionine/tyrosine aminotransferase
MRLTERVEHIGTETAFQAAARARALEASGRDVIHLHLGEPDFDTPPNIIAAASRALAEGQTHYAPPRGVPEFREAVAADFTARRGVPVSPDRVVITPGAKPVMAFTLMALAGPGDEVIVPDPGFPIYESMTRFVGATPVPIQLRAANGYRFDLDELRSLITPRTRLLIFNSPQNPTGAVLTRADIEGIAAIAMAHDLAVLADEIYARIIHEGEHVSILSVEGMQERTVVLDGLSKTYAMTGWRLGWGILPAALVPVFERLLINTVSCTATYAQVAGAEALNGPQDAIDAMVAEFRARRQLVVDGLNVLPGVVAPMPAGAFYAFPDVSGTGMSGQAFAERLLDEAGVSVLAGTAFGHRATSNLRVSYATSQETLRRGLARIAEFLASVGGSASTVPAAPGPVSA